MKQLKAVHKFLIRIQSFVLGNIVWFLVAGVGLGIVSSITGSIYGVPLLNLFPSWLAWTITAIIFVPLILFYAIPAFYYAFLNTFFPNRKNRKK